MQRNQKATYWQYTGNHIAGKDCRRNNPYGYPLSLVSYLSGEKDACGNRDLPNVKISHGKNDGFGCEITVSAPKDTWKEYWVKLADECGKIFLADWRIDEIECDEDGLYWAKRQGDIILEVFRQSDDETPLQMAMKGYARFTKDGKEWWFEESDIAKES